MNPIINPISSGIISTPKDRIEIIPNTKEAIPKAEFFFPIEFE